MCWKQLYGYRIKRGKATIVPEEAAIVREVFARVIAGDSLSGIARDLENRGIPRPCGGKWRLLQIRRMVENEKYIGDILSQKTYVADHLEKKKKMNRGELAKYYISDVHEPIVDKETFNQANKVLQRYHEAASSRPQKKCSVFSGVIKCMNCGAKYTRTLNHDNRIWSCLSYKLKGPSKCQAKQIHEETLYAITTEVLGLKDFDPIVFQEQINLIRVEAGQTLVFCFRDGHEESRKWVTPSRRDSWTPEMREKARQRMLAQRGEKHV